MSKASQRFLFRQEMTQAEEARRTLQEERESLTRIAQEVLAHFGLKRQVTSFLESPEGIALLANCCNAAAKRFDGDLYQYKPMLIEIAIEEGVEAWQQDGIVYLETQIGQVSFHVFEGEDEGLPESQGRCWSEIEYQWNASLVAQAWLEGWNREQLHAAILEKEQERYGQQNSFAQEKEAA